MITDVHCHILPGADDGAAGTDETERMLRIADGEGIGVIFATCHFTLGESEKRTDFVRERFRIARDMWKRIGAEKEMYLWSEILWEDGAERAIADGGAISLGGGEYVLTEFLPGVGSGEAKDAVRRIRYAGYRPVLAHIERYGRLAAGETFKELCRLGAVLQVNASSVCGEAGLIVKRRVIKWISDGLVSLVGTDAHDSKVRPPVMTRCLKVLRSRFGGEEAARLTEDNPAKLISGSL